MANDGNKWGATLDKMGLKDAGPLDGFMIVFKRADDHKIYWGGDMGSGKLARQFLPRVKQMARDLKECSDREPKEK